MGMRYLFAFIYLALLAGLSEAAPEISECPDGLPMVICAANPCDVVKCPAHPTAECRANYCGGCNATYYVNNVTVSCKCPDGLPMVICAANPCDVVKCPAHPTAECRANYCGGCHATYYVNNVTVSCTCPKIACTKTCEYGYKRNDKGCHICECRPSIDKSKCDKNMCIAVVSPVCGSDGKTYSNKCHFGIAQCKDLEMELLYHGKCINKCTPDLCKNGGSCHYEEDGRYECECRKYYHGYRCELYTEDNLITMDVKIKHGSSLMEVEGKFYEDIADMMNEHCTVEKCPVANNKGDQTYDYYKDVIAEDVVVEEEDFHINEGSILQIKFIVLVPEKDDETIWYVFDKKMEKIFPQSFFLGSAKTKKNIQDKEEKSKTLGSGPTVGIILCSVVLAAILILFIYKFRQSHRSRFGDCATIPSMCRDGNPPVSVINNSNHDFMVPPPYKELDGKDEMSPPPNNAKEDV